MQHKHTDARSLDGVSIFVLGNQALNCLATHMEVVKIMISANGGEGSLDHWF